MPKRATNSRLRKAAKEICELMSVVDTELVRLGAKADVQIEARNSLHTAHTGVKKANDILKTARLNAQIQHGPQHPSG